MTLCGRPLTFGDTEQILEVKRIVQEEEFKAVPDCLYCSGSGAYNCEACDGEGKELEALEAFHQRHPGFLQ